MRFFSRLQRVRLESEVFLVERGVAHEMSVSLHHQQGLILMPRKSASYYQVHSTAWH